MARIFYGVMGDARGHISRALTIALEMRQHEFLFVGGGTIRILQENGYQVENVPTTPTIIRNHRVDLAATVAYGAVGLARMGPAIKSHLKEGRSNLCSSPTNHLVNTLSIACTNSMGAFCRSQSAPRGHIIS